MKLKIPGDNYPLWRTEKFIQYVMGSTTGADTWLLKTLSDMYRLSLSERIWLCWLHTCCNCEVTAWWLYHKIPKVPKSLASYERFWYKYKNRLVFVTDRVYVKSNDEFPGLVYKFQKTTQGNPVRFIQKFSSFSDLYKELCSWRYMGRYSTELFLEAIVTVSKLDIHPDSQVFDINAGRTMTSGLLNTLGYDDIADSFDKGEVLPETACDTLQAELNELYQRFLVQTGLNLTLSQMTPKLCSWRKLFKGQRYGNYYIDRQLQCLTKMEENFPQYTALWDQIYEARKLLFPKAALGENFGRKGIQKGLNRLWVEKGITGFEGVRKPTWNLN